jgi:hypothetical protein
MFETTNDGTAEVSGPNLDSHDFTLGILNIVDTVILDEKSYPVTAIRKDAFKDQTAITTVTIPATVIKIGHRAFFRCSSLTSVSLKGGAPPMLGDNVFDDIAYDCQFFCLPKDSSTYTADSAWMPFFPPDYNIRFRIANNQAIITAPNAGNADWSDTRLTFPVGVYANGGRYYPIVAIDPRAFKGFPVPAGITLSPGTTTIGAEAFAGCTTLRNFTTGLSSDLTTIEVGAFASCTSLQTFVFSTKIKTIGVGAFSECAALTTLTLFASLTTISSRAFAGCTALTAVTILADEPPFLATDAFAGVPLPPVCRFICPETSLNAYRDDADWETYFPDYDIDYRIESDNTVTVTALNPRRFVSAASANTVVIPDTVLHQGIRYPIAAITANAFKGCFALQSLNLTSLTPPTLASGAFADLPETCTINCPNNARAAYTAISQWLPFFPPVYTIRFRTFTANGMRQARVIAPNDTAPDWDATRLNIPDIIYANAGRSYSITTIESEAFSECTALTTLTLPATLKTIGDRAFAGCTDLAAVTILASAPPSLASDAFAPVSLPPVSRFICPEASLNTYRTNAVWETYFPDYDIDYRIESNNTVTVTALNPRRFASATSANTVVIPDTVLHQGVLYPVAAITADAFKGCIALKSLKLTSLTPPTLASGAFADLPETCTITCPNNARAAYTAIPQWIPFFPPVYTIRYSTFIALDGTRQARVIAPNDTAPDWDAVHLNIPDIIYANAGRSYSVTAIESAVFAGYSTLKTLSLPATLKTIGDRAFAGCTDLTAVTILADEPPSLAPDAFADVPLPPACCFICSETSLSTYRTNTVWGKYFPDYDIAYRIEQDNTATVIAPNPRRFKPSSSVTAVQIPATVLHQGIPYPVTAIGNRAFAGCTVLTSFTLLADEPPSLANDAFDGLFQPIAFSCPEDAIETYRNDPDWKVYFPTYDVAYRIPTKADGHTLEDYVIVTGPNPAKFPTSATVTAVTIPATVQHNGVIYPVSVIASGAFADYPLLATITLQCTDPPLLDNGAFDGVSESCTFSCPDDALPAYTATAAWIPYFPPVYDIAFRIENAQAIVTGFNTAISARNAELTFPATVYANAGRLYPVTAINADAFKRSSTLRTVTIPDHISRIGDAAFAECTMLTAVTLLSNIPPTLGNGVFDNISSNCTFTCPEAAYTNYTVIPAWEPFFPPAYSILFDIRNGQAVVTALNTESYYEWDADLIIPSSVYSAGYTIPVTSIAPDAFTGNLLLHSVTIPATVTDIGSRAFAACTGLSAVTLLRTIPPVLGKDAFDALSENCLFTCPLGTFDAYTAIPAWEPFFPPTFSFLFRIENEQAVVTAPNSMHPLWASDIIDNYTLPAAVYYNAGRTYPITAIAPDAFRGCTSIQHLTLPASISVIGESAFAGCTAIESVSLLSIAPPLLGDKAFIDTPPTSVFTCPDASLTLYQNDPSWWPFFLSYIYDVTFRIENDYAFVTGANLKSTHYADGQVVIPDSVEVRYLGTYPIALIAPYAFAGQQTLKDITIAASVTVIGHGAFSDCSALTKIRLLADTPPLHGSDAFTGISQTAVFFCPETAFNAYINDPQWSPYFTFSDALAPITVGETEEGCVRLYDLRGKLLYQGPAATIPTPIHGLYILDTPTSTRKIRR